MNIGIIGSGNIGGTAARLFADHGHEVAISNTRGPESLTNLVSDIGPRAHAAYVEDAADFGEVVLVAIPFFTYETLPSGPLADKIVIDATNYYPGRDGEIDFGGAGSSELVARHLSDSQVVKAFNTMYYETLGEGDMPDAPLEDRLVLFVSADDPVVKDIVGRLIEEIGFTPVDVGSLEDGRKQQPGSPIYNVPMNEKQARDILAQMDREGTA